MRYFRRVFSSYSLNSGLFCCLCFILTNSQLKALEKTKAEDVVATQLRAQGIPCTAPSRAEKDKLDSRPDEMTWIISCKEATYKVTLIPHVGAKVDIMDPSDFQSETEQ
jgi:hypothetical protein